MITAEQKEGLVNQSFERFEADGKEWVSANDELALDYMLHHPDYQKRRRVADGICKALKIPRKEKPTNASSKYNHEVQIVLMAMRDRGEVEFRFMDKDGDLPETPPEGELHSKDRRYRRVPAEATAPADTIAKAA